MCKTINDKAFVSALKGQKIIRQKIRINKEVIKQLTEMKKDLPSSLELYEMVECCFDYFDFSAPVKTFSELSPNINILEELKRKRSIGIQMNIREDIFEKLNKIKKETGVPVQEIISQIVKLQLLSFKI